MPQVPAIPIAGIVDDNRHGWDISAFTRVFDALCPAMTALDVRASALSVRCAFDFNHADLVDEAVRHHRVAVVVDVHVAHDVAAARDGPRLELLPRGIEAHDGVRLGAGLAVPDGALGEDDAVRLRLRPA